ncbi:MAG: glucose-1-phosphate adenylyltransferase [Dehalococcoidia bacterium]|nr:glucose-1-phosphate adenylyltransferase [Dehalococcoidia bacterium]MDW8119782.1 glucose-1-phosphate adenylyltransferase [Chloroflexota bacterium]
MDKVVALILAGGQGQRLSILAEERAKPAVPFAGKYRIIDFTLSNCVNSGIYKVGVLTQYRPHSLLEHIGAGRPWDLDREHAGLSILQPYTGRHFGDWYQGTADAVFKNLSFVEEMRADTVLILAGDHVYKMDYRDMIAFHQTQKAHVTVGVIEVPWEEAHRFGILTLNDEGQVLTFEEKPPHPRSNLGSMGIYVFSRPVLQQVLEADARNPTSSHDFGKDILPALVGEYRVFGYRFKGYWRDVGTVKAYWDANMEFLEDPPPLNLHDGEGRVRTRPQDRPPAYIGPTASLEKALVCHGSRIHGIIRRSVLFQGVVVEEGAIVEDSILFDDVVVRKGAHLRYAIVDKEVVVGEGATIGCTDDNSPNRDEPDILSSGITLVGKRAAIPPYTHIGRNCKVMPGVTATAFPSDGFVSSGTTIAPKGGLSAVRRSAAV